jgi:tetratricopeptide (TPR) repeat protein
VEALRHVLDYAPGDAETLIALSRCLEELGRVDEAAAAAEDSGVWKTSKQAATRLASLLRRSDDCPRALEVLDAAKADHVQAREERSQCYIRMARWEEARDLLSGILKEEPGALFSRVRLLRLDVLEGRSDAARAGLDALDAEAPGDAVRGVLALEQALLFRLEGQAARAERVLNELQNDPDAFPDAPMNLMELHRAAGCIGPALETAEAMARRSPANPRFLQQVLVGLLDAGDLDSAELYLRLFRETYGEGGWRDGAWALVEHGFPQRGLEEARAMALAYGESRETRFLRAGALEKLGRYTEAVAGFKALAADHPDDPIILNFLGYTLVERGIDPRAALPLLQRATRLAPDNGAVWDSLGWAHFSLGNAKDAYLALKRASRLEPLDATILEHLADAEAKLGMTAEAALHYRQALALGCGRAEIILTKLGPLR